MMNAQQKMEAISDKIAQIQTLLLKIDSIKNAPGDYVMVDLGEVVQTCSDVDSFEIYGTGRDWDSSSC